MESVKIHGADTQILRANKLTLVERLADDLAHEIKNPLHSMVINLEVLKRRVSRWSGADATELMRYVGILSSELDRVSGRVDLLLRMVRADHGGDPVTLADAVEDLLEVVELERERQGISIDFHPPTNATRAHIPRDTARQIVLNLLLIAIDAASPDGTIEIIPQASDTGESLRFRIASAAPGDRMTPERVEDDRSMRATVRALVDSLGGQMDNGQPGDSSELTEEIRVTLPSET